MKILKCGQLKQNLDLTLIFSGKKICNGIKNYNYPKNVICTSVLVYIPMDHHIYP